MFCTNCGHEVDETDKFCSACGYLVHAQQKRENTFSNNQGKREYNNSRNYLNKALVIISYVFGIYGFFMIVGNWLNSSGSNDIVTGANVLRMFVGLVLMILSSVVIYKKNVHKKNNNTLFKNITTGRKLLSFLLVITLLAIGSKIFFQNSKYTKRNEFSEEMISDSLRQKFLGSWVGEDTEGNIGYVVFKKNNRFQMTYPNEDKTMYGEYLIIDSNTMDFYPAMVDGERIIDPRELKTRYYFEDDSTFVLRYNDSNATFKKDEYENISNNIHTKNDKDVSEAESTVESSTIENYITYTHDRFGFAISYPSDYILLTNISQNGDAIEIHSKDDALEIKVSGSNTLGDTAETYYTWGITDKSDIIYKHIEDNWFIISWIEQELIKYQKTVVGKGSQNTLLITYPKQDKENYDIIIANIASSFMTPDLNETH